MRSSPGPSVGSPKLRRPSPAPGPSPMPGSPGRGSGAPRWSAGSPTLFDAVRERAPRRLEAIGHELERLGSDAMAAARRRLDRADDGTALMGRADPGWIADRRGHRRRRSPDGGGIARRRPPSHRRRHRPRPCRRAGRVARPRLDLRRGFALATTPDGSLVPTRAAALAAGDLTLIFADGAVSARVGNPLPAPTDNRRQL